MSLEEKLAKLLIKQKLTLSTAESCTGGLLAHRLTNVSGSSNFLKLGLVVYSNESKTKFLKVYKGTLHKFGAVSEQTAITMAKNVRKNPQADIGVGITGIAGPTGGSQQKPVGLTYIAIDFQGETLCLKCHFQGTRLSIKKQAATLTLKLLMEFIT